MASETPALFKPLTIRGLTLKNRIGMSPMCQYSAKDGFVSDWHFQHLVSRAVGGAGLIIVEATGVEPRGRISDGCTGLWDDAQIEPLRRIVKACQSYGAKVGIQLGHAGRKASARVPWKGDDHAPTGEPGGWDTVAPSAIAFGGNLWKVPHELTVAEIKELVEKFASATRRASEAGFDLVEIHGAHGYLIHEFYSPLSNKRTDEYGGSFENRTRFLVEVAVAMRAAWGNDRPLAVRLSCTDWVEGGWTVDDTVQLVKLLRDKASIDLVDCSSAFNTSDYHAIPFGPGFQVAFAERVRRETGVATAAIGCITTAKQSEDIVAGEKADVVLLAREFLRDPYFAYHAAVELGYKENVLPINYSHWRL